MTAIQIPPFCKEVELVADEESVSVPGQPFVDSSYEAVDTFMCREVECPVLDELAPNFFVFAKRRSTHVDALHDYVGTGRHITITEDPGLHLVRDHSSFHIKPIPQCLLNHAFWRRYLIPTGNSGDDASPSIACRSALGFLRSYAYLIQHESDFRLAQKSLLLPKHIGYAAFQHFIQPFRSLPDAVVAPRYQYGHIRLTRLNLAVRLLRPRSLGKRFPWSYRRMHWHSGQYLGQFAAPLLFLFACFTLVLSSMQVGLAAQPGAGGGGGANAATVDVWDRFSKTSLWFSVAVIIGILGMAGFVVAGVGMYVLNRVFVGFRINQTWVRGEKETDLECGEQG